MCGRKTNHLILLTFFYLFENPDLHFGRAGKQKTVTFHVGESKIGFFGGFKDSKFRVHQTFLLKFGDGNEGTHHFYHMRNP